MDKKVLDPMTTIEVIELLLAIGLQCERLPTGWQFVTLPPNEVAEAVRRIVNEKLDSQGDAILEALADESCRACLKPNSLGGKCLNCCLLGKPANPIWKALAGLVMTTEQKEFHLHRQ